MHTGNNALDAMESLSNIIKDGKPDDAENAARALAEMGEFRNYGEYHNRLWEDAALATCQRFENDIDRIPDNFMTWF